MTPWTCECLKSGGLYGRELLGELSGGGGPSLPYDQQQLAQAFAGQPLFSSPSSLPLRLPNQGQPLPPAPTVREGSGEGADSVSRPLRIETYSEEGGGASSGGGPALPIANQEPPHHHSAPAHAMLE